MGYLMALFQSLIGILVDFNYTRTFGSPQSDRRMFQSLIGILVDFNDLDEWLAEYQKLVSIPDRDFSWFQH